MVTCPYCGTSYQAFQSNCKNCGGPLLAVGEADPSSVSTDAIPVPPLAPRPISERYVWRLLYSDGWWIAGLVLGILGVVFSLVGAGLTLGRITAFVGIPFLLIGLPLLVVGGWVFGWRYQKARKVVNVLRDGDAARGQIVEVQENYSVTVNGRHPWVIRYEYSVNGQTYTGKVTTLHQPGPGMQECKPARILYLADEPQMNSLYPHP